MRFIYFVALLIPQIGTALESLNCPEEMSVSFETFQKYDNEELRNFAEGAGLNWQTDSAKIISLRDSFGDVQPIKNMNFELKNRRAGLCQYKLAGTNVIRAEILNRNWDHKDILKIAIENNGLIFVANFPLLRVLPKGIKLRHARSEIIAETKGASVPVGWTFDVRVAVGGKVWRTVDERILVCRKSDGSVEMRGVGAPQIKGEFDRQRLEKFEVDLTEFGICRGHQGFHCYTNGKIMVNIPNEIATVDGAGGEVWVNRSESALTNGNVMGEAYLCQQVP